MTAAEQKILTLLTKKRERIFIIVVTLCSVITRCLFRNAALPKEHTDTLLWLGIVLQSQRKFVAAIGDYFLAGMVVYIAAEIKKSNSCQIKKISLLYTAVIFSVPVILSSALLGQMDAYYIALMLLSAIWLIKGKTVPAFIILGIASALNLQALYLLPFIVLLYVKERKGSILYFFIIPISWLVMRLPNALVGRHILEGYIITGDAFQMYDGYPCFWTFFNSTPGTETEYALMTWGFATVAIVGLLFYLFKIYHENSYTEKWYMLFLILFLEILVIPSPRIGRGYIVEILTVMLAFLNHETAVPAVVFNLIGIYTYAAAVYGEEMLPLSIQEMSWVEMTIFFWYIWYGIHCKDVKYRKERNSII